MANPSSREEPPWRPSEAQEPDMEAHPSPPHLALAGPTNLRARWHLAWRLIRDVLPYPRALVTAILLLSALAALSRGTVVYLVHPFFTGVTSGSMLGEEMSSLVMVIVGAFILRALVELIQGKLIQRSVEHGMMGLRRSLMEALLTSPLPLEEAQPMDRMSTLAVDLPAFTRSMAFFFRWVGQPLVVLGLALSLVFVDPVLAILAALALVVALFAIAPLEGMEYRQARLEEDSGRQHRKALSDIFMGQGAIQALGLEREMVRRYGSEGRHTGRGANHRLGLVFLIQVAVALCLGAALWQAGRWVKQGSVEPGHLMALMVALALAYSPLRQFIRGLADLVALPLSAERLLLALQGGRPRSRARAPLKSIESVEIVDAWAQAPPGQALQAFHLQAHKGQTVALVGAHQAGCSLVLRLITGFEGLSRGRILFSGTDGASLSLPSLLRRTAVIPRDVYLINGTISQNILAGLRGRSQDDAVQAATLAGLHEDILAMPKGYATRIARRDLDLSLRLRLSIARALARDPDLVIIHEQPTPLDSRSEELIERSLSHLTKGRLTLIRAYRPSTMVKASLIVVMDRGRVVDRGGHGELIERCEEYGRLFRFTSFEQKGSPAQEG